MKRIGSCILGAALVLGACNTVFSQETAQPARKAAEPEAPAAYRPAIISLRDVLVRCEWGTKVIADIQGRFSERRIQLGLLEQDIKTLQEQMQSDGKKGPKASLLRQKFQAYAEQEQKLREDVGQEESQRFGPVLELVNKVLAAYIKEKQLSSIQDKAAFLYYANSMDITDEIVQRVNQAQPSEPSPPATQQGQPSGAAAGPTPAQ